VISSVLISVGSFVVLLSIVVIFHEYGHYKTGRLLGIGVERFAIGFGPALFKWTRDGIEFRVNAIPVGGYVKFVGDEPDKPVPEEMRDRAFNTAPIYKRMLTVIAGPAMNLVLAFLIFCAIFVIGYPAAASLIADVGLGSVAEQAGLKPGDHVTAINGDAIRTWQELSVKISKNPDVPLTVTVDREGQSLDLTVTPEREVGPHHLFLFETERGVIGISPLGFRPLVGVADAESAAYQAGLRTGDYVLTINGREVRYLVELKELLGGAGSGSITLGVSRGEENIVQEKPPLTHTINLPAPESGAWTMSSLGIDTGELYIYQVQEDSPAAAADLQRGDKLVSVDGEAIESWGQFTQFVRDNPGRPIHVGVMRDGRAVNVTATPKRIEQLDILGQKEVFGQIGVQRLVSLTPVVKDVERYWNPLTILSRGFGESWIWTVRIVQGIYYIVVGKVPATSIGGPIAIARLAGESARMGLIQFLFFMAIISVNLAFINLLPIPIFDGGHVLLFGIEGIRGKPLSERAMAVALRIGIAFLAALFLLVFFNDFRWLFFQIKEHLIL